jgi:Ras-related protein Rab-28
MRAVKADKHAQFADDNQLYSYFVSAKSGDHVQQAFYRIAADLAGIVLTKSEIEQKSKVVQAEIINHPQHDPSQEKLVLKEKESKCTVQ